MLLLRLRFSKVYSNSRPSVLDGAEKRYNPIVVIDNYDSFTYDLCQYMGELGCHLEVYRNDEITVEELKKQGVQFHPESIITTQGKTIVQNFIKLVERKEAESQNQRPLQLM